MAAICTGTAGAVLAIEASRLARNGRDWHTLLEFCTLVNSLIIDEDGVYDPKLINDRLLLGMKGTFSELELSILRQRSQEALRLKAARGDLHTSVAVGYVRSADDRLELDPDKRVREALHLAFHKFAEFGSVRQVAIWLCDEGVKMPIVVYGPRGRMVEWKLPRYNTIHRLLTNPIYAGAYVFGRTGSQVRVEAGRKLITRNVRRLQKEWEVLIRDHHEGYISWEDYENNRRTINGNANMKGEMVPGSVRNGGGLLVGLLRCGHCGRKLKVQHNGLRGVARYLCNDANVNHGRRTKCIAFGNMRIDAAVSAEVMLQIAPLGLDAALQAIADRERAGAERLQQIELALEQARYEAARAHRQYDAVDPENRLVIGDLERRWNERLAAKVEVAVQVATRWIIAKLRNRRFFSLGELNAAIAELVTALNNRVTRHLGASRRALFDDLERSALKKLPAEPYAYAEWKECRAGLDYHVEIEKHYYSVPHALLRETMWARITARTIEVFHRGKRVAAHVRSSSNRQHTTVREHMPSSHQRYADWTPERIQRQANEIGPKTSALVEIILRERTHPEQRFRACIGILRHAKSFGRERLEAACTATPSASRAGCAARSCVTARRPSRTSTTARRAGSTRRCSSSSRRAAGSPITATCSSQGRAGW